MDQPKKRAAEDTPGPRMHEQDRRAATAAWAARQGLLTIATTLRQFLGRADQ